MNYEEIENKLIEIRNRLPLVVPNMNKKELHHLSCIKQGIDLAVQHLIKLKKINNDIMR